MGGRPNRPAVDRAGRDSPRTGLRADPRLVDLRRFHQPAAAVRSGGIARRCPRLCRPGAGSVGAQPGSALDPAQGNRAQFHRLADRRNRRTCDRGLSIRRNPAPALRLQRRLVRRFRSLPFRDRPGGADRIAPRQSVDADGRGAGLCSPQPAGARRDHARPIRGPAGRGGCHAAGLCARHFAGRGRRAGPAARRAGGRCDTDRDRFFDPAAANQCRRQRC